MTETDLRAAFLDSGVYFDILDKQFHAIAQYLEALPVNESDIVVFDIDEVCLVNLMYTNHPRFLDLYEQYDTTKFNSENGLSPLVAQCEQVFDVLAKKRMRYAFVTGRRHRIRQLTIDNLAAVGLSGYDYLYTCPDDFGESMVAFKTACRKDIASKGNTVVCCIGDQVSDITGDHVGIPFLMFNPFYVTP